MVYIFFCFIVHVCWFDEDNKMNMLTCKKCLLHVSRISVLPKISVQYFSHICSLCWGGGEIKVTITYNLMLLKNFNTNISVVVWEIHRVHMSLDCFSIICCSVCYLFAENDFRERLFFFSVKGCHICWTTELTYAFDKKASSSDDNCNLRVRTSVHPTPTVSSLLSPNWDCCPFTPLELQAGFIYCTGNQNGCWYAVQDVKSAFELISRQERD